MTNIKAVLWDFGNVLVDWQPRLYYQNIIKDPKRLDFFMANVCNMEWHYHNDLGKGMFENIANRQKEFPEYHDEIAKWYTNFGDTIAGIIEPSVKIVKQLFAQNFPQYILSNLATEVEDACFEPYDLKQYFNDIVISGTEKLAKPDKRIFELTLQRMGGLNPSEVFFIDDNHANINAASEMGFNTHLFKNDGKLEINLREIGILK